MIRVVVNGEPHEVEVGTTLAALLVALEMPDHHGVAVAVDREVVPRARHAAFVLADGATVEVIRAVGGG